MTSRVHNAVSSRVRGAVPPPVSDAALRSVSDAVAPGVSDAVTPGVSDAVPLGGRDATAPRTRGDVAVIVPAAGRGQRLGPGAPKALRELAGAPLLVHAARRLAAARSVGHLVVAVPPGGVEAVSAMLRAPLSDSGVGLTVVVGGAERQQSVAAALAAAPEEFGIVLVHDAARAFAPPALTDRVAAAVRAGHDAVIPVLPVVDTITRVDDSGRATGALDRGALRAVQTPQGFRRAALVAAHAVADPDATATDDASLVAAAGGSVCTVPGEDAALKITRPFDLRVAELVAGDPPPGTRS